MNSRFQLLSATLLSLTIAGSARADLIGYYALDGNLNDTSYHGNDGTPGATGVTFGAGYTGQGLMMSGADKGQDFSVPINVNALSQFTFGGWFHVTATDPIRGVISNDTGNYGAGISIDYRGAGTGYSAFNGSGVFGGVAPSPTGFDFVAVTYNRTTGVDSLYVNGTQVDSTGNPGGGQGQDVLTVGANPSFDSAFGGTIDNVFVYNTALTSDQIANIRANGVPEPTSLGLLAIAGVGLVARRRRRC